MQRWGIALALSLAAVLLVAPLPLAAAEERWPLLVRQGQNAAHILLFAWIAWLAFGLLRTRFQGAWSAAAASFVIVVLSGVLVERVQALVGRDPSWTDVANNACGAAGALLLVIRARTQSRAAPATRMLLLLLAGLVLTAAFIPLGRAVAAYVVRAAQSPVLWRGDSALQAQFATWYAAARPVMQIHEVPLGAVQYEALEVVVRNDSPEPLRVNVRVHGTPFNRRAPLFSPRLLLAAGETGVARAPRNELAAAQTGARPEGGLPHLVSVIVAQETIAGEPFFSVEKVRLVGLAPNGDSP